MTHIRVGKLTISGSDNGLSPERPQAIIWTNAGILLIWHPGTNFSEIWIEIYTFSLKKMHLNMSSGKWWPFCLGLNVLKPSKQLNNSVTVIHTYIDNQMLLTVNLPDVTCDSDCVMYTPKIYLGVLLSIFASQMCLFDSNVSIYIIATFLFFYMHLLFRWYYFTFGFNATIHILFYSDLNGSGINVVYELTSNSGTS